MYSLPKAEQTGGNLKDSAKVRAFADLLGGKVRNGGIVVRYIDRGPETQTRGGVMRGVHR
jgi:hypothetical protein